MSTDSIAAQTEKIVTTLHIYIYNCNKVCYAPNA
jgi:hypothetical protein